MEAIYSRGLLRQLKALELPEEHRVPLIDMGKQYLMYAARHNSGVIRRKLFGLGTPRRLQNEGKAEAASSFSRFHPLGRFVRAWKRTVALWEAALSSLVAQVLWPPIATAQPRAARAA